jgi:hypothetical protein
VFAGLRAAHAVGHDVQAQGGSDQVAVFIIAADASLVRRAEGLDHELSDYTRFGRGGTGFARETGTPDPGNTNVHWLIFTFTQA